MKEKHIGTCVYFGRVINWSLVQETVTSWARGLSGTSCGPSVMSLKPYPSLHLLDYFVFKLTSMVYERFRDNRSSHKHAGTARKHAWYHTTSKITPLVMLHRGHMSNFSHRPHSIRLPTLTALRTKEGLKEIQLFFKVVFVKMLIKHIQCHTPMFVIKRHNPYTQEYSGLLTVL